MMMIIIVIVIIIIIIIIIIMSLQHIISACPVLTKEQYIKRHDEVCAQLHLNISNEGRSDNK